MLFLSSYEMMRNIQGQKYIHFNKLTNFTKKILNIEFVKNHECTHEKQFIVVYSY